MTSVARSPSKPSHLRPQRLRRRIAERMRSPIAARQSGSRGTGAIRVFRSGPDRYFVTEDAKAASRRATASLARLTESSEPAADCSAVLADCAAWLAEFCALVAAVDADCALASACEVA